MEKKVLSIGIAAYNMELFLARCLESLIIPDIDKLEIIVINHASTDCTHDIAMEYKTKYPGSIKVVDVKVNGHYGRAVNNALAAATGKYFKLLDADDTYCNENLPAFVDFLNTVDDDIVFSPYVILNYESIFVKSFSCPSEFLNNSFLVDEINWNNPQLKMFRAMHSMAIKTALLQDNNYYQTEGIAYSDTQLVFFSDLYSKSCSFFCRPVYNYYLGRDGQTMSEVSIKKNCLHFYENAIRMLDVFSLFNNKDLLSNNRLKLLADSVYIEVYYFFGAVIGGAKNNAQYKKYINDLLLRCSDVEWKGILEKKINSNRYFKFYKNYHCPNIVIYYLRHIKAFVNGLWHKN